jgi:hypothetical protein
MFVRTPFYVEAVWLVIDFSPLAPMGIAIALHAHIIIIGILGMIGLLVAQYFHLRVMRHTRRRVLQSLIRARALKEKGPFILISRSYDQAKEFVTHVSIPVPLILPRDNGLRLIEALVYDLCHKHAIVVLGDKDRDADDFGGRALYMSAWPLDPEDRELVYDEKGTLLVGADVTWEEIFIKLAQDAQFVLLLPANSEGVRREISLLKQEKLGAKTIVFMWPGKSANLSAGISASGQSWEALRQPLAECGLDLPPHREKGALLRLGEDFRVAKIWEPIRRVNILTLIDAEVFKHAKVHRVRNN